VAEEADFVEIAAFCLEMLAAGGIWQLRPCSMAKKPANKPETTEEPAKLKTANSLKVNFDNEPI
jgi:hypothetical protein